jgi:Rad3-related DNA helicase
MEKAFETKKFVILEAPTGFGKSACVMALAKSCARTHIMTPQKILQNQYMNDFSDTMFCMKGRGNFTCVNTGLPCGTKKCKLKVTCNDTPTKTKYGVLTEQELKDLGVSSSEPYKFEKLDNDHYELVYKNKSYDLEGCPYKCNITAAKIHDITLHNFHSFLYQGILTGGYEDREMLIVDEAHNIEGVIMDFFHINISNDLLNNRPFPRFANIDDILSYFTKEDYSGPINSVMSFYRNKISIEIKEYTRLAYLKVCSLIASENNDFKLMRHFDHLIIKIQLLIDHSKHTDFVYEIIQYKNNQTLSVKPLYIHFWMHNFFDRAKKVFLTSATILDKNVFCKNLGITDAEFIRMPSEFPKENRKTYVWTNGSLSYKDKAETLPKLIPMINKIITHYGDKKGIIHTHSYELEKYIREHVKSDRFIFMETDRDAMLEKHFRSTNSILIAPAMHEGLDLKDDHSRFQIIIKMPYPSSQDIQIKNRLERYKDWDWYNWLTALKLVQSYGRSVRHKDDYADTYILDGAFINFYRKGTTSRFLPEWFKESIVSIRDEHT